MTAYGTWNNFVRRISDSVVSTAMRKRFSKDDEDRKVPVHEKWATMPLSGSGSSQFNISQHEIGMESMVSQTRPRRGAISASVLPLLEEDTPSHCSTPVGTMRVEQIGVSVHKNGLQLINDVIQPGESPIGDLLKPVLTRVDQFDLSQCSCQITNLDSVEFDLSTPAVQYSGGHISVDIHAPCSPDPLQTTDSQDSLSIEETKVVFSDVSQCLSYFDKNGIGPLLLGTPVSPCLPLLPDLPRSWRDVVEEDVVRKVCEEGGKEEDLQQYMWELIQTEHSHIQQLQVVVNLFMRALEYIMCVDVLTEVNYNNIFGYMKEILEAHMSFWENVLEPCWSGPAVQHQLFDIEDLIERFPEFQVQFEIYEQHCIFESENLSELKEAIQNPSFKTYLDWCESQPECQRLKLTDYLAKPMQRLTKYPLLLKQIIKSLTEEGQRERMASVLRTVEEFVTSVNTALQSQLEVDTVKNVMGQLDNYSAIAAQGEMEKILTPYTVVDLLAPMPGADLRYSRMLLHHDVMKCKDSDGKERVCVVFIFTDLVLIARRFKKYHEHKLDVIKPPHRIDRIIVRPKDNTSFFVVYINEFNVATAAFCLKADTSKKAKDFETQFDRAQTYYEKLVMEKAANTRQRLLASPTSIPDITDHLKVFRRFSTDRHQSSPLLRRNPSQLSEVSSSILGSLQASQVLSNDSAEGGSVEFERDHPSLPRSRDDVRKTDPSLSNQTEDVQDSTNSLTIMVPQLTTPLKHVLSHKHKTENSAPLGSPTSFPTDTEDTHRSKTITRSTAVTTDTTSTTSMSHPSLPIHRVDTVNTSIQSVTIAFEDTGSSAPSPVPFTHEFGAEQVVGGNSTLFSLVDLPVSMETRGEECRPSSRTSLQSSLKAGNSPSKNHGNHFQSTGIRKESSPVTHPLRLSRNLSITAAKQEDDSSSNSSPSSSGKIQKFFKNRQFWKGSPPKSRASVGSIRATDKVVCNGSIERDSPQCTNSSTWYSHRGTVNGVSDNSSPTPHRRLNSTIGLPGCLDNSQRQIIYKATWV